MQYGGTARMEPSVCNSTLDLQKSYRYFPVVSAQLSKGATGVTLANEQPATRVLSPPRVCVCTNAHACICPCMRRPEWTSSVFLNLSLP